MVILEAKGVGYGYVPDERAVQRVDLAVSSGEVVVIIGPNGAGKSTLLRLMAGVLAPDEGRVELGGVPIGGLDARARAREVALVPQSLYSLPDLTVGEFVNQGRYAHGGGVAARLLGRGAASLAADRRAVQAALAQADLEALGERPLSTLSGGQRQRALVARALAQEAQVVLVDEPTNSLDPRHQVQVFRVIAGLGCEGRAAVVVTHDLNLASQFGTRVVLMDAGRVVATGSAHDVLRPEVLVPVYGRSLAFGERHVSGWGEARPWVLAWDGGE